MIRNREIKIKEFKGHERFWKLPLAILLVILEILIRYVDRFIVSALPWIPMKPETFQFSRVLPRFILGSIFVSSALSVGWLWSTAVLAALVVAVTVYSFFENRKIYRKLKDNK